MSPWIIALLAAIGGLVFLVFICAIIHCCVLRKRKVKKRGIQKRFVWRHSYWSKRPNINVSKIKKMCALQDVRGMENLRLYDVFVTAFDSQSQFRKQLFISFVVVVTSFEWKAVFSAYSE